MKAKYPWGLLALTILFSCSSGSEREDQFVGIWAVRGTDACMRITKKNNKYELQGQMMFDGTYSLVEKDMLRYMDGDYVVHYYKDGDILIISSDTQLPSALTFDRKPDADSVNVLDGKARAMPPPAQ